MSYCSFNNDLRMLHAHFLLFQHMSVNILSYISLMPSTINTRTREHSSPPSLTLGRSRKTIMLIHVLSPHFLSWTSTYLKPRQKRVPHKPCPIMKDHSFQPVVLCSVQSSSSHGWWSWWRCRHRCAPLPAFSFSQYYRLLWYRCKLIVGVSSPHPLPTDAKNRKREEGMERGL